LQEAYFNASISKNLFYAGEEVTFNISSFDANKLPLMDAKVKLNVSLQSVDDWFSDSMFIPYKWFQSYFEYENLVDPSGITQITLPDSLFLNAKMRFRASVELWNSDNERKYFNLYFTFDPTKSATNFILMEIAYVQNIYIIQNQNPKRHQLQLSMEKRFMKGSYLALCLSCRRVSYKL
jgi:hypothetical protein